MGRFGADRDRRQSHAGVARPRSHHPHGRHQLHRRVRHGRRHGEADLGPGDAIARDRNRRLHPRRPRGPRRSLRRASQATAEYALRVRQDHLPGQDRQPPTRKHPGLCQGVRAPRGARGLDRDHGDRNPKREPGGAPRRRDQGHRPRPHLCPRFRDPEPITTETLRYGQRVTVMAVAVPPIMRTPEALAVFGPPGFGIDAPFTPIETLG